jgi:Fe-S-cluster-containing dehydrogenase component
MQQHKKSVTARIPKELYDKCNQQYANMTDAVIDGLELLCNQNCKTSVIAIEELNAQIEERDVKIQELVKELENHKEPEILQIQNIRIQELQDQLKVKDDQIKVNDGHQNNRIEDLRNHIFLLDNQLRTKDDQLEKVNENQHKQAVHIQSLIQEISRLNTKLLPENIEKSKPWWRFW